MYFKKKINIAFIWLKNNKLLKFKKQTPFDLHLSVLLVYFTR